MHVWMSVSNYHPGGWEVQHGGTHGFQLPLDIRMEKILGAGSIIDGVSCCGHRGSDSGRCLECHKDDRHS